jgi:terminase small subunit-like protein
MNTIPPCPVSPTEPECSQQIFASRMGRPSSYTDEIAQQILDRISNGEMLTKICQNENMPPRKTVYTWQRTRADFRAAYARAREEWAEFYEEKVLEIAFNDSGDFFIENGRAVADHAQVQRARLQVDTLKWFMMKWAPRRYGESPEIAIEPERIVARITRTIVDPAPAALPAPPLQLSFDPGPLPAHMDREILARLIAAVKRHVPKAKDRDPNVLLNEITALIDRTLAAHYGPAAEMVSAEQC